MYKNVDFFLFLKRIHLEIICLEVHYQNTWILHCFIVNAKKKTPAVDIIKICNQHEWF